MKLPAIKLPSKTLNIIVLILGVLVLAAILYYSCANREGFDGSVPTASQTSAIPSDTPGATTANPTTAKPQTKDIQAALDELDAFFILAATFDYKQSKLPIATIKSIEMYRESMQSIQKDLKDALASPETSKLTLKDVTELRAKLNELTQTIRSPNLNVESTPPTSYESTVVAGTPGVITLKELQNLVKRIDEEHLRLANLRSTSATLVARQSQLEKLAADIRELIGAVERKEMKLEDVPISPATAEAFLKQIQENKSLPPLIEPRAKIADGLQAHVSPTPGGGMDVKALNGLLESAKYLKWELEVKLEYDPKLAARDNLVKRLEAIERRLSALAVSETPISKEMYEMFMKELQVVSAMTASTASTAPTASTVPTASEQPYDRPSTSHTRSTGSSAEYPSMDKMATATSVRDTASGNAILNPQNEVSPDVFIRPGFVMNDDQIKRRGSASAFDDSLVGGADYKKRSQELCRQVRGANLGDPVQFGCISNPDAVGPDYSWKGNFTMVCNRLGDTWGGWYPEMFGCPKYDPTQKFKATMM